MNGDVKTKIIKIIKLRECPCCGGEAEIKETRYIDATPSSVKVLCKKCALQTKSFIESLDYCAKEEAAKVWNRRESKQPRCPICGEEGFHILTLSYLPNKARAQIHCDMCGTYINIPDTSKFVGEMSELVFNEK